MKGKELIELIDNLTLAALRYELAKQNMDKAEETLDRLSERFNNEINNIDTVEEIKSMCSRCDNKATTHLRLIDNTPVFEGKDKIVGDVTGTERYESVCQVCYHKEYDKRR